MPSFSTCGHRALTIAGGVADDLSIGVPLEGRYFAEPVMLRAAAAIDWWGL